MADHIPAWSPVKRNIPTPLTLTQLQTCVGGFIKFIELSTGDLLVVNEASLDGIAPFNSEASSLAGKAGPIHGDVVFCSPTEIA